jgi:DNA-binding Lrp family transcriptional regulator
MVRLDVVLTRADTIRIVDQYKGIREVSRQLDPTNIKILTMMAKLGPRNLLEVSRRCRIPLRTVYHRIEQIEAKSGRVAKLIPNVARLDLVRANLFITAVAGREEKAHKALKIPNLWRSVESCEGAFTNHSIQLVPTRLLRSFRRYIVAMEKNGLIKSHRIVLTGDSVQSFPDFSNYNSHTKEWAFDWGSYLKELETDEPQKTITDPPTTPLLPVDTIDLGIVVNLELNARANFTDIARDLNVSPSVVKYRYDTKLLPSGVLDQYDFLVVPYPLEIVAYHEVMLQFTSSEAMNKFYSLVGRLFFIGTVAKVLRQNTLFVRTYIPHTQVARMFEFYSQMASRGLINDYSAVRIDLSRRDLQTISPELFSNSNGWVWDLNKNLAELRTLCSSRE